MKSVFFKTTTVPERGSIQPFYMLVFSVLLLCSVVSVNAGLLYLERIEQQNAYDAGAYGGALLLADPDIDPTKESDRELVRVKAMELTLDNLNAMNVSYNPADIEVFLSPAADPRIVEVRGKTNPRLIFLSQPSLGKSQSTVGTYAKAGIVRDAPRGPVATSILIDNTPSMNESAYRFLTCPEGIGKNGTCIKGEVLSAYSKILGDLLGTQDSTAVYEGLPYYFGPQVSYKRRDMYTGINTENISNYLQSTAGRYTLAGQPPQGSVFDTGTSYKIEEALSHAGNALSTEAKVSGTEQRVWVPPSTYCGSGFCVNYPGKYVTEWEKKPLAKDKFVVMLTDGGTNNPTEFIATADRIRREQNAKVLMIGIGKEPVDYKVPEFCFNNLCGAELEAAVRSNPILPTTYGYTEAKQQYMDELNKLINPETLPSSMVNQTHALRKELLARAAMDPSALGTIPEIEGTTSTEKVSGPNGGAIFNPTKEELIEFLKKFGITDPGTGSEAAPSKPRILE